MNHSTPEPPSHNQGFPETALRAAPSRRRADATRGARYDRESAPRTRSLSGKPDGRRRASSRAARSRGERARRARRGPAVHVAADDGMPQRRRVYADLVGAPGLQASLDRREVGEALEHAIARDRALAAAGGADRHLDPIARVAPD